MSLHFKINGESFWIDEFCDGFAWCTEGDQGGCFSTEKEAQQDAMDYVASRNEETAGESLRRFNENTYGTYDEQKRATYLEGIRL